MRASVANDSSFNAKVAVVGKVRGKVTDPSGEPLVGATVRVKRD